MRGKGGKGGGGAVDDTLHEPSIGEQGQVGGTIASMTMVLTLGSGEPSSWAHGSRPLSWGFQPAACTPSKGPHEATVCGCESNQQS